jgi:3-methyladenine DNA glycosylase AlkC
MSESTLFKDQYNEGLAQRIGEGITAVYPAFNTPSFVTQIMGRLDGLELKGRVTVFTEALHDHLPPTYPAAWKILEATFDPEQVVQDGVFADGWRYWPMAHFIELYGLDDFETSMQAMYEITKRHSAEFPIRQFLLRYPERTLAVLQEWTADPSEHVRRLVSEGTRPRLPWGIRLHQFITDPTPTLALLEKLKDDPSEYVRRSVANHLNDITKDNPALALETLTRWKVDATPERESLIRHALRSLVKAGDPVALRLLGYGEMKVSIQQLMVTPSILRLGESLAIEVSLQSETDEAQALVVDYAVHFVKANGRTAPKVFKWRNLTLNGRQTLHLRKQHPFKPITTRRYYSGQHWLEIQVNGQVLAGVAFELETAA